MLQLLFHKVLLSRFSTVLDSMLDPYRPELYYMRGPGPKWRAKHFISSGQ